MKAWTSTHPLQIILSRYRFSDSDLPSALPPVGDQFRIFVTSRVIYPVKCLNPA